LVQISYAGTKYHAELDHMTKMPSIQNSRWRRPPIWIS